MSKKTFFMSLIITLIFTTLLSADPKGEEIASKSYNLSKPTDMSATTRMILIDKKGNKQVRSLKIYSKEGTYGTLSFTEFTEPADVKGTRFLSLVDKNGDTTQRLYLPALKKVRRISSSGKDSKFMGSDLTYYDMEDHDYEDFDYEFVSENQTIKGKAFEGMKFYIIKRIPKDKDAPYSYRLTWINMDNYFVYQAAPYDKDGKIKKVIIVMETKKFDDILLSTKTVVVNKQETHKTLLTMENIQVNKGIKDSLFSIQNLK